ncbi:toprim domain-containing protein [Candidatus Pacearchaeota archaeon]|nr:toprim domain-containing protein [Candidatus Pacearchaeota archaeon]
MDIGLEWQNLFSKYLDFVFIVEGKKDTAALHALGFEKVYEIHQTGISIHERIESILHTLDKKDTVCILTDFDKKGKQLYFIIKREMQDFGIKIDSSFRNMLLRTNVSHIEGFDSYVENHSNFNQK